MGTPIYGQALLSRVAADGNRHRRSAAPLSDEAAFDGRRQLRSIPADAPTRTRQRQHPAGCCRCEADCYHRAPQPPAQLRKTTPQAVGPRRDDDGRDATRALPLQLTGCCANLGRSGQLSVASTWRRASRVAAACHRTSALAHIRLALGADTIALDTVSLQSADDTSGTDRTCDHVHRYRGRTRRSALAYTVAADSFLLRVAANVAGAPAGSALLLGLPRTLQSNEPDTLDDIRHLAVSYRLNSRRHRERRLLEARLSRDSRARPGPLSWVATRNKYFLVAYRAPAKTPFSGVQLQGGSTLRKGGERDHLPARSFRSAPTAVRRSTSTPDLRTSSVCRSSAAIWIR